MRSPGRYKSRKRSRSRSPSPPSPQRPSKAELRSIRITINNVKPPGSHSPKFSILSKRDYEPSFEANEEDLPSGKSQKKIQIEIKRNIARHRISDSPVRRSIRDPNTVVIPRPKDEGRKRLFEFLQAHPHLPEERVIELVPTAFKSSRGHSMASESHHHAPKRVKDRLGSKVPGRNDWNLNKNDRILDRNELESRRPQVKPWEVNPELVPRNGYYFEHDNREGHQREPVASNDTYSFRGRGRGRGRSRPYQRGAMRGGNIEFRSCS